MNFINKSFILPTGLFLLFGALYSDGIPAADAQTYQVTVDTSTLASSPNGDTFAADFNLQEYPDPLTPTSSVSISNINLGGGVADTGSNNINTAGNVSGNLTQGISLQAANDGADNELYQDFTPGSTLTFDVNVAGLAVPASSGDAPTTFSFDIFDDNDPSNQLSLNTTDPLTGTNFAVISLDSTDTLSANGYSYTDELGNSGLTVSVSQVAPAPESSSLVILAMAVLGLGFFVARSMFAKKST